MQAHTSAPVLADNRVELLLNGDQIFPAKLAAIRSARVSITYAELFYAAGPVAADIAAALAERCRAGVPAKVLLDGVGALSMKNQHHKTIEDGGCQLSTFRPVGSLALRRHNHRNHRRLLVVDGRIGITGGSGVSGGVVAIAGAGRWIHVTNPYFVPDRPLADAFLAAARRGVRVVVLVPGTIDHALVREAGRRNFGELLQAGIEIYEYQPALLHSKTMVVDGVWATVGSTNLDHRSFALNDELNVAVYDSGFAAAVERAFAADVAAAKRVTYEAWQARGPKARFYELITIPLRNLL